MSNIIAGGKALLQQGIIKGVMADLGPLKDNFQHCKGRIAQAVGKRKPELQKICPMPRLVAVTKFKPKEVIMHSYDLGERHFGENYVQELVDKALDPELQEKCPEVKFHFIGHLQKNKINKLLSIPEDKLWVVETVDSEGLARSLNDALGRRVDRAPLNVMVQVNTSREDVKSGVNPEECISLVSFIRSKCSKLKFIGLMTIGALEIRPIDEKPNADFVSLVNLRKDVCDELGLQLSEVELSMGMSSDFEEAIELGSTNVRVGSILFGARPPKSVEQHQLEQQQIKEKKEQERKQRQQEVKEKEQEQRKKDYQEFQRKVEAEEKLREKKEWEQLSKE